MDSTLTSIHSLSNRSYLSVLPFLGDYSTELGKTTKRSVSSSFQLTFTSLPYLHTWNSNKSSTLIHHITSTSLTFCSTKPRLILGLPVNQTFHLIYYYFFQQFPLQLPFFGAPVFLIYIVEASLLGELAQNTLRRELFEIKKTSSITEGYFT